MKITENHSFYQQQNLIVLLGQVRNPGSYKFFVHYYLPYDIGQDMPVKLIANGQEYKGIPYLFV